MIEDVAVSEKYLEWAFREYFPNRVRAQALRELDDLLAAARADERAKWAAEPSDERMEAFLKARADVYEQRIRADEREKAERLIEACLPIFPGKSQDYIDGVQDALAAVRGEGESE
jgi:regulator of protease activity HflC (stomatin/prohibitin superfamily)